MNEDRLQQLLRDADLTIGHLSATTPDLAQRILRRAHQQRVRRIATAAATVCLLFGLATWVLRHGAKTTPDRLPKFVQNNPEPGADQLRSQLAALENQIASDQRIVNHMLTIERLSRAQARLAELHLPPVTVTVDPVDRAGFSVLYQADRLARIDGAKQSAQRAYREIITYFPTSPSADAARQRLGESQKES